MTMTGIEVARVRTTPTIIEWRDAIFAAWRYAVATGTPTVASLAVLWAQFALETDRGRSCFNWNLGNIKAVPGDGRDFCVLHTFEYIDNKRVEMDDHFRAHPTLVEGAREYLTFLTRPSYAVPWSFVLRGDADGFARALKDKRYYTSPVEEYARGLRGLATEFQRVSDAAPPSVIPLACTTCHDPDDTIEDHVIGGYSAATSLGAETAAERRIAQGFDTPPADTHPDTPVAKSSESQVRRAMRAMSALSHIDTEPDGEAEPSEREIDPPEPA
jgi:hypothetical protein